MHTVAFLRISVLCIHTSDKIFGYLLFNANLAKGRGGGGQKWSQFIGHHLWTFPKHDQIMIILILKRLIDAELHAFLKCTNVRMKTL